MGTPNLGRAERIARYDRDRARQCTEAVYRLSRDDEARQLRRDSGPDRTDLADLHTRLAQAEKIIQDQGAQLADVVDTVRWLADQMKGGQ